MAVPLLTLGSEGCRQDWLDLGGGSHATPGPGEPRAPGPSILADGAITPVKSTLCPGPTHTRGSPEPCPGGRRDPHSGVSPGPGQQDAEVPPDLSLRPPGAPCSGAPGLAQGQPPPRPRPHGPGASTGWAASAPQHLPRAGHPFPPAWPPNLCPFSPASTDRDRGLLALPTGTSVLEPKREAGPPSHLLGPWHPASSGAIMCHTFLSACGKPVLPSQRGGPQTHVPSTVSGPCHMLPPARATDG